MLKPSAGASISLVPFAETQCHPIASSGSYFFIKSLSGYLLVDKDGYRLNIPLSNSGTFAFNTNICNSTSDSISIIPVDGATGQAGRPKMISINEGNNAAGHTAGMCNG